MSGAIDTLDAEFAAAQTFEPAPAAIESIATADRAIGADYDAKLRRLGSRLKGLLATPPPHDELSEERMRLICALVKRNFTPGEVRETLEQSPWLADLVRRKGERHAQELIATEIAKAVAIVVPFPPDRAPDNVSGHSDNVSDARKNGHHASAAAPSTKRFPRTDTGQAELFAHLFGARVRYDHLRGLFLVWRAHWWEPDQDMHVYRLAIEAARYRYATAVEIASETERKHESTFAIASENRQRIDAMLAIVKSLHPIADSGEGWDADPWLIGVENGVVELKGGRLRDGRASDKISRHAPVTVNARASCPTFDRFVGEILPEPGVRAYVQNQAGAALTGLSRQELQFLHGGGANGKSTLINVLMSVLGPMYAQQAAPGLLLKARGERHPTELADLYGARLVVSVEVDDGRTLAEALVKWLTGGDRIKARFMKRDFFQFDPTFKLWLLANARPNVRGEDEAIWRRIKLVPFNVTIPEHQRDDELGEKLRAELPGVFNWMLVGCLNWQRNGMQEPPEVRAAVEEYRAESDVLAPFLADRCVLAPTLITGAEPLFKTYKAWAESAGLTPRETLGNREFGTRVARRFERKTVDGRRRYVGVGIRDWRADEG